MSVIKQHVRGRKTSAGPLRVLRGEEPAPRRAGYRRPHGTCRHCGRGRCLERRSLCQRCYLEPDVRPLYPPESRRGRQVHGEPHSLPTPAAPTDARPGSEERIEAMRLRYERGEHIRHPADAGVVRV